MIYITPFDPATLRASAPSSDSGFRTLADVAAVMGDGWQTCSDRLIVYPGVAFSDYPFLLTDGSAEANMTTSQPHEEAT